MYIVLFSLRDYIETICQALEGTDCVLVPYYEVLPIIGPLVSYLCSKECLLKYLQFDFAGCEVFFNKMEEMDLVWNFYVLQFSPCTCQYHRYLSMLIISLHVFCIISFCRLLPLTQCVDLVGTWVKICLNL